MKHGIAASTPKKLEVKPTALGILLDAQGAIGGLARAYTTRDDSGEDWLESWFTRRTQLHFASSISEDEPIVPLTLPPTHVLQLSQRTGLCLVSIRPHYFRASKRSPTQSLSQAP